MLGRKDYAQLSELDCRMPALLISERKRRQYPAWRKVWYYQRLGQSSHSLSSVNIDIARRRMRLDFGGDDITELLHTLLQRISFPYRELDITKKWCDWHLMENLKERMIVLSEVGVYLEHVFHRILTVTPYRWTSD